MPDNICIVPYTETFGNFDRHGGGWQQRLFNWDYGEKEVE